MKIINTVTGNEVFRSNSVACVWEVFNKEYNTSDFRVTSINW